MRSDFSLNRNNNCGESADTRPEVLKVVRVTNACCCIFKYRRGQINVCVCVCVCIY